MLLWSRALVGRCRNNTQTVPLDAQTNSRVAPTHCGGGAGGVLGSKGHEVGGLGCASPGRAPLQHEAAPGIAGQQQDKVPEAIEGIGEAIQGGDVGVPEGTGWGAKEMETFWGEEGKRMLPSSHGGGQIRARSSLHQDAAKHGQPCLARGPRMAVPPSPARRDPRDSPGVGGRYPSQLVLGLFSANLLQNRGFPTRRQHHSNASSSSSAGGWVQGVQGPRCALVHGGTPRVF